MGGALTAISPDFTRVIGVPAMNYSGCCRGRDFDQFASILYPSLPHEEARHR